MNEPWTFLACKAGISCVDAHGNLLWHEWDAGQDVAERVLASVNACAGMDDPAAEIDALKADIATLVQAASAEATENARLRKSLERIGQQWLGSEMAPEFAEHADYQGGYETIVLMARATLRGDHE